MDLLRRLGQVLSDAREQGYVIDQRDNADNRFEYRMPLQNVEELQYSPSVNSEGDVISFADWNELTE